MATVSQGGFFTLTEHTSLGALAPNYRVYTYIAGTTTHKNAYIDQTGNTAHTYTSDGGGGQYIATNARGELPAPLYLTTGAYDITVKTDTGSTVRTRRIEPTVDYDLALRADLAASSGSSIVGFLQAGTGAVARTVQSKLREILTSADFSGKYVQSTALGVGALDSVTTGYANTAVGEEALTANTTGIGNVAIGFQALKANTTGGQVSGNVAIGTTSMVSNTTGDNNTAIGTDSLFENDTGSNNTAIGSNALGFGKGGGSNTAVGWQALFHGAAASDNTAVGLTAAATLLSGVDNVALGVSALFGASAATGNVACGAYALFSALGSGNVALGYKAGLWETGSNSFYVDNMDRINTAGDKAGALFYGTFNATPASQTLTINATVTVSETLKLRSSAGLAKFATDMTGNTKLSIANNATAQPFGAANNFSGLIIIKEDNGGATGVFLVGGNTTVTLVSQSQTSFTITAATGGKSNVYLDGSNFLTIENKNGSTNTYQVMALRMSTGL